MVGQLYLSLSNFLDLEIINNLLPLRETIANNDGKWVRKKTDWRKALFGNDLERFIEINNPCLEQFGYK